MNPTLILLILQARFKIALATFLITVLSATALSLALPKYYKATTQMVLNYTGVDTVSGKPLLALQLPGYVETQMDIIKNRSVALKVVDTLHLVDDAAMQQEFLAATEGRGHIRDWIANRLLKRLAVEPARDSSVLSISFSAREPLQAAAIANAFAHAYKDLSTQLKVEPAQEAATYFSTQAKTLRDSLEQAQSRLSKYQQEQGITSADEKLDIENARLTELSQQLVAAQALAIEARSRQQSARSNAQDSPDVALNPVIQSLRIDAGKASSKLAELSQRLGASHPQYEAAQAELAKIQAQLQNEIRSATNSLGGTAQIQQQREAELRAQLAQQKTRVLHLNRLRDEMAVLQQDVETAQKAMDAATQRFSQTSMEGQSKQSDIAILNAAQPPGSPATPRIGLNILLAVVLGGLLGIGLGLIAEMLDRRIRSSSDIADLLQVPVVALIQERPTVTGLRRLPGSPLPASSATGKLLPSA